MLYKGIDIYEALITENNDGIFCISLVEEPAVERNFMCFSKEKKAVKFAISEEEKHLITGVVMLANTPIYRRDGDYEYYLTYSEETIRKMAEKMLSDKTFNNISLQHNGVPISGCRMVEVYIKDSTKGITPNFIEDIPEGSLLATFHIEDEMLWNEIKNGNLLNGFSLEGLFTVEKLQKANNIQKDKKKMSKISKFVKTLMKFGEEKTDKGTIYFAEDEIAVGIEVFVDGEDEKVVAEDGEYILEDERTIVVENGKVVEIKEKEAEEEVVEEPKTEEVKAEEEVEVVEEPEPEERDFNAERIDALEKELEKIKVKVEELSAVVGELTHQPVVEPIEEVFEKVREKVNLSGLPKGARKAIERLQNCRK